METLRKKEPDSVKHMIFARLFSKTTALFEVLGPKKTILLLIVIVSVIVRLYGLGHSSLWLDEAIAANPIIENNITQLLALRYPPVMPLFAITVHSIVNVFGNSEFTLRLLPCLFSIASCVLIYLVAKKLTNTNIALLATALFSLSPTIVYYAKEVKQYSGDMFFALLLILEVERIIESHKTRYWILFVVSAIVGLGFSHSLILLIPSLSFVLLYYGLTTKTSHFWFKWIVSNVLIVFTFSLLFLFIIRFQVYGGLISMWEKAFPDVSSLGRFVKWMVLSHLAIMVFSFWSRAWIGDSTVAACLIFLLVIIGLSDFARKKRMRALIYCLSPLALALVAAFLHKYPYGGNRLVLFAVPMLAIGFAQGTYRIVTILYRQRYILSIIVICGFLMFPMFKVFHKNLINLEEKQEMRPVVNYLQKHKEKNDKIYVHCLAREAFKYYYGLSDINVVVGKAHGDIKKYIPDIDSLLEDNIRIWFVFSHLVTKQEFETKSLFIEYLNSKGRLITALEVTGAFLYLFVRSNHLTKD